MTLCYEGGLPYPGICHACGAGLPPVLQWQRLFILWLLLCRREFVKCGDSLRRAGRANDAKLFDDNTDIVQLYDNCKFRSGSMQLCMHHCLRMRRIAALLKAQALPTALVSHACCCRLVLGACSRLQSLSALCRPVSSMSWEALLSCAGIVHTKQMLTLLLPPCRYPIVLESGAWTTNMKQKLSCGSILLSNKLFFYDFFTRALKPGVHFVEVDSADICNDVVTQVGWHAQQPCSHGHHGLSWMATQVGAQALCHNLRPAMVGALSISATLLRRVTPLCCCSDRCLTQLCLPVCPARPEFWSLIPRGGLHACPNSAMCGTA